MNNIKYLLTLAMCFCAVAISAQKRVTGHVFSKMDGPIFMATVAEVDPSNRAVTSAQTDANGNFSIVIKRPDRNFLQVTYIGYKPYKTAQPIGSRSNFRIEMIDNNAFKEAVVKSTRKVQSNGLVIPEKELSIATQTFDMDAMEGLSFETAGEALQGQIAGLDIVSNSGNLGAGTSMRLRGVTSINGNQEPLIVVDGYILPSYDKSELNLENMDDDQMFANLLQINPEDIKSIKVLKDASATAIYGSDGSNGVIEITTRRGTRGKTRVNFTYRFTGTWQPEGMKMLNGDGYTMMLKEAYFNPQQSDVASGIVELMYLRDTHPAYYENYNKNTDWVKEVTQFGQVHNFGVSINGGGEKAQFRVSGNYDHSTGSVICQEMNRITMRMALDYYVSDRIKFSSNFSLAYTKNDQNYNGILGAAYNAMPNMSIYRYEYDRDLERYFNTGEYFIMPPRASAAGLVDNSSGRTSYYLNDMISNGNPVATANLAWSQTSTYTLTPQFALEYKLWGKEDDEHQLNYKGEVQLYAYTQSVNNYYPQQLTSNAWSDGVNLTSNGEYKDSRFETKHSLVFKPYFSNEDHSLQVLLRGELETTNSTSQNLSNSGINGGITSSTAIGYMTNSTTSTGEGHRMAGTASIHYAYASRYSFDVTLRADGKTKFGSGEKWGFFPGISARWNVSEEKFFKPLTKVVNLFGIRLGWGQTGNASFGEGLIYNNYGKIGVYNGTTAMAPNNLRLTTIHWEKTSSWNLGFDVSLFENLLKFNLDIYRKNTKDLLNYNMRVPSTSGYNRLSAANVGSMKNEGWELWMNTGDIAKIGKFHMNFKLNFAQVINTIESMDATVLANENQAYGYKNLEVLKRVQIGNALGGIYGFRFKGIYAYDYDHNGYFLAKDGSYNTSKNDYKDAQGNPNTARLNATGQELSTPVARDAQGNVIYDKNGNPLPMYFNYGGVNYQFQGGDVIYEDINHDGQIDDLDIVYLGGSNPKITGGFGVDFTYGRWTLRTMFNFRMGNKILNLARLNAESMRGNNNQSASVAHRWRKNGQVTEIPRAMNATLGVSYNALINSRYVEDGDFVRFNYFQLAYNFPTEKIKKLGLSSLRLAASGNNLIFWTKYSGVDPEHSASGYSPCIDNSKTPRSRSFTLSLSFGF